MTKRVGKCQRIGNHPLAPDPFYRLCHQGRPQITDYHISPSIMQPLAKKPKAASDVQHPLPLQIDMAQKVIATLLTRPDLLEQK